MVAGGSRSSSAAAASSNRTPKTTAHAFFSGKVRDNTTDKSRKLDKTAAMLKGKKNAAATSLKTAGGGGGGGGTGGKKVLSPDEIRMREEVAMDIHRRIENLGKQGKQFEDGARYQHDARNAEDAMLIIEGKDPAAVGSTGFVAFREIPIDRGHWVASMMGIRRVAPYGVAYVHTDGSITLGQHGTEVECRCGAVHCF